MQCKAIEVLFPVIFTTKQLTLVVKDQRSVSVKDLLMDWKKYFKKTDIWGEKTYSSNMIKRKQKMHK